jgi:aspartate oxidase
LGLLVTEKLRGMGATPLNVNGELFVHHLETRDVEAAAFIRECRERKLGIPIPGGMNGIWLDIPLLEILHGEGTVEKNFPAMVRQYSRFGINISRDPIIVYPTQHYQNGGIEISADSMTGIENLFAAGENTGGVQGRNRLAGNSLLDILVLAAGREKTPRTSQKK